MHDVVRAAQQAAFEAVRPGVTCQEIDRAARSVITEAGYGERFIHRTGHGIGVTTHEPPYMVEGEEQPLQPGMCFSIEPGIYLSGRFGVRIEDIVTVTGDGAGGSTTPTATSAWSSSRDKEWCRAHPRRHRRASRPAGWPACSSAGAGSAGASSSWSGSPARSWAGCWQACSSVTGSRLRPSGLVGSVVGATLVLLVVRTVVERQAGKSPK